ncbi:O-antigen ligase family protein [Candidatus Berkelbacteria bacterium]|nr:O-antigen ligase family protein [Candidatus Berkelbacteria bacterium]
MQPTKLTLLTFVAFLTPAYLIRFTLGGIPTTLLELVIWGVFVWVILRSISDDSIRQLWRSRRSWLAPPILFLLGAFVGLILSDDLRRALGLFKGFIFGPILVYLIALLTLRNKNDLERLAMALVVSSTCVALLALILWNQADRALGPYALDANASANYLAFALAPALPLVFTLKKIRPLVRIGIGIIILMGLFISASRAGIVGALLGFAIGVVLSSKQFWRSLFIQRTFVGVITLSLILSWWLVRPEFSRSTDEGGRVTSSNNVRWQLWSATGELVRQAPILGLGLGDFQADFTALTRARVNYLEYIAPHARTPHNLFVGIWLETGLLGLAALLLALVLALRNLFRAVRHTDTRLVAAGLLGSWSVFLAIGLVDMPIWKNDNLIVFWLIIASSLMIRFDARPGAKQGGKS